MSVTADMIAKINDLARRLNRIEKLDVNPPPSGYPVISGTPVAGHYAVWTAAGTIADSGFGTSQLPRYSGTPAANQLAYWTGAGTVAAAGTLFWDNTNSRLGIAVSDPASQIESASTSTSSTRGMTLGQYNTGAQAYLINALKARGTRASPSTVSTGDFGLVFLSKFYDGASYVAPAGFGFKVNGAVSTGTVPVDLILSAGATDAQSLQNEVLRLYGGSGNAGIGALSSVGASMLGIKAGTSSNDAAVGGVLYVDSGTYANSSTTETDLATYTVPANTLSSNNMELFFEAWGTWASNGNSKSIKVYFGADSWTVLSGITAGGSWLVRGRIIRTGAATQDVFIEALTTTTAGAGITVSTASRTLSSANALKLAGTGGATNDIKQEYHKVSYDDQNT